MSSLLFSRLLFINDLFALLPRSVLLKYCALIWFGFKVGHGTAAQEVSTGARWPNSGPLDPKMAE
jgi:hypothetical protein